MDRFLLLGTVGLKSIRLHKVRDRGNNYIHDGRVGLIQSFMWDPISPEQEYGPEQ
jgi:hypothetical protein